MGRNKGSKERGRVWMEGGGDGDVTVEGKGVVVLREKMEGVGEVVLFRHNNKNGDW